MAVVLEPVPTAKAHTVYRLKDGTVVPGATTVLSVLAKPALVPWANKLGLEGVDVRKYVDALAAIGTLAHGLIEEDLGAPTVDRSAYSPQQIDRAENCLLKWYEWRKSHRIEAVTVEKVLVSERHRYGGTIDAVGAVDDTITILDFKTGKAIYDDHLHQVAAYWRLAEENGLKIDAVRILQVGRSEDEGFSEKVVPVSKLRPHWKIFKACLDIWYAKRKLKEE